MRREICWPVCVKPSLADANRAVRGFSIASEKVISVNSLRAAWSLMSPRRSVVPQFGALGLDAGKPEAGSIADQTLRLA
ncbi:hypothetical protein LB522_15045 [Mesorhizobium sp. CA9]|uniref:hypothetical protein n=1 Tax=unclassified Mesorhizobium TaxID=325217 RepID=UPI001CCDBBF5|nr:MULTISPECIES: hypothetical protein [unclassified Mesorhizobium]MBZ9734713.1 hypothetical protein [Mesorhizobium sp. CA9]MBZ9833548.1 hypothetical protein [Mesorhizobium sp. CA2]MBZ9839745.1 hypothetical protein [Mesorhizobium sp. CA3]MBZ9877445.1 hypothetical protein [Mesorhizobium sp. Ca11]MBZ9902478.1 hypothetical protein [Mesorhizobium sp. CA17]